VAEVPPHSDRWFFAAMALLLLGLAAAGFAPTFYARSLDAPPLAPLVFVHGFLGTVWLALFALQAGLVAAGRLAWHRRMGLAGAVVTFGFVVSGGLLVARFEGLHGDEPGGVFAAHLFTNVAPLVAFAMLAAAGVAQRAVPARHKRLMLLAAIALSPPAIGRLFAELELARFNLVAYASLAFACSIYDWRVRGRPHAVALLGAAALVAIDIVTGRWLAAVGS
jgi:hypothetical protein